MDAPDDPTVKLVVAWHDAHDEDGEEIVNVDMWTRGGMDGDKFVSLLRRTADAWERGDSKRLE